ncbi:MAG: lamin tail domain-containing protein [Bacteroidetes bacterium CHB5]|nr:lamin tail domain-containing protein [Bacteroidetes bacterium CHB5]
MMLKRLKRLVILLASFGFMITLSCEPLEDSQPVTDEGLVINEIYASGEDWVELYNSLETSINIGGYFIYDNAAAKYQIPAGTTIPAKGFLVLVCNDLGTGLNTNFKLTSAGETVYLENASGTLIDRVEFPELSAGQTYGRYPDGSANLSISGVPTRGVTNGGNETPAIVTTTREPIVPGLNQVVTIKSTLVSTQGLAGVKLYYRFNTGAFTSVTMALQSGFYTATIPAQANTGTVEYYLEAEGTNGLKSYEPATAPAKVLSYLLNTDALPQLVINEFMAFNSSCCPDDHSGTNEYDDWIEIYNAGSTAVDIGGMHVSDNKANPFKYKIPDDEPGLTTIAAGGFLLIWADNQPEQGPLHADFGLSTAGEDVGIYYLDGRTINDYTFGAQSENVSWGRTTNGGSAWKSFNSPTPGQSN